MPALTNEQVAAGLAEILDLSAPQTATLTTLLNDWNDGTVSRHALAQRISHYFDLSDTALDEFRDWLVGTPTGGAAAADGTGTGGPYYALTGSDDVIRWVMSPAAMLNDLSSGAVDLVLAAKDAAEASATAAAGSASTATAQAGTATDKAGEAVASAEAAADSAEAAAGSAAATQTALDALGVLYLASVGLTLSLTEFEVAYGSRVLSEADANKLLFFTNDQLAICYVDSLPENFVCGVLMAGEAPVQVRPGLERAEAPGGLLAITQRYRFGVIRRLTSTLSVFHGGDAVLPSGGIDRALFDDPAASGLAALLLL